ncbi:MAG: EFR1 family ferrodoxin [Eubacteriales bacterium]
MTNGDENMKCLSAADRKINLVCSNIKNGKITKRGFNLLSRCLGLIQGASFPSMEMNSKSSARTDSDCNGCGICVKICPMNILEFIDNKVNQKDNCTLCYRCVNACPKKAITVFFHRKPVNQYKGIQEMIL